LKLILAFAAVAALVAGPALAQGTFNDGRKPAGSPYGVGSSPAYGAPSSSSSRPSYGAAPTQRIYGAPEPPKAEGFKPYKPYQGGSTYASPRTPAYGAKPCETSVYANACDKRR
jgi:hypothetical protein